MTNSFSLEPGTLKQLGSYIFTADSIIEFARKYDPQPFHIDANAAKESLFGGLCASGWHTAAIWMKLHIASLEDELRQAQAEGRKLPIFGPSPGVRNIRWFKPVYAGSEIHYSSTTRGTRPLTSKPGWSILEFSSMAHDENGELIMSFESAVLIKQPNTDESVST